MNSCEVVISQHSIYFMNSRFPDFTSEDVLMQFSGSIKKGKASGDYQALVERALRQNWQKITIIVRELDCNATQISVNILCLLPP